MIRFESLVRLADPASPRLAEQVRVLAVSTRQRLAQIVFDTALEIGVDPLAGLVEKVVSWQAAHRVRADLQDRTQLVPVQCQLVHGLEALNDRPPPIRWPQPLLLNTVPATPASRHRSMTTCRRRCSALSQQHQPANKPAG